MKQILFAFALVALFFSDLEAQDLPKLNVCSGLVFGAEAGIADNGFPHYGPGINLGLEYFMKSDISIVPNFSYFFSDQAQTAQFQAQNQLSVLNIDARFYFHEEKIKAYGFFGVTVFFNNYESRRLDQGVWETLNRKGTDYGYVFGAGIIRSLSHKIDLGTQVRYQAEYRGAGVVQLVLSASITYRIR
jgi:hypothetical protein